MAILNLGSINWDRVYTVARFPQPGETLTALSFQVGLGGKGLNQSVAVHRSGGVVTHFGAVGRDDLAILPALRDLGLDTDHIQPLDGCATGSALILVDEAAENMIVLDPGANRRIPIQVVQTAIAAHRPGDWLLLQNETNGQAEATAAARQAGLKVAMVAAPFDTEVVRPLLPMLDLLAVNEIEFSQLLQGIGGEAALPDDLMIFVSLGARGAELRRGNSKTVVPGFKVQAVDTTGAGDTAFGALLARMDRGDTIELALRYAMAAAALQVTRQGAVSAIPMQNEVDAFLRGHRE